MNLPGEANVAIVDLLSAAHRYSALMDAVALLKIAPGHPALNELEATVRDAEQALLAIFTAVLGQPDVEYPDP